MRGFVLVLVVCGLGCSSSKVGTGGAGLDVPVYPDAKVISSGENQGIIGANFETTDAREKVISYYEGQLGSKQTAGAITTTRGGHRISVIITDTGGGKTAGVITETK